MKFWPALIIICLVGLAYSNSFHGPFIFDDESSIVSNPTLSSLRASLSPPHTNGLNVTGRPLLNFSLAINHAISGTQVWSYHALNFLIHLTSTGILFDLVRRTLSASVLAGRFGQHATEIALTAALLWGLHPIETEAVTYIIQRAESFMAFWYLSALWCFSRGALGRGSSVWLGAAVVCCALGMAAKEVMVTAPLIIALYDRTFVAGAWREVWRKRRMFYFALSSSWALLYALVLSTSGRGGTVGFGSNITPLAYALTQTVAIIHYLRLVFWPSPLVFDLGRNLVTDWHPILGSSLILIPLVVATLWAAWRGHPAGFCGMFFFCVLAPSSSVLPVITQTMAEYRMYLPLAPLVVLVTTSLYATFGRRGLAILGLAAIALGVATLSRNHDYRDELSIWKDSVEKWPSNSRAQNNFASALQQRGRYEEANEHFARALELEPNYISARYNWGAALLAANRPAEALIQLERAVQLAPTHPDAQFDLGNALVRLGRPLEAIPHFEIALRLRPQADVHYNLGYALSLLGRWEESEEHFRSALKIDPTSANAHRQLAQIEERSNRLADAEKDYEEAARLAPDDAAVHSGLGLLLAQNGLLAEASQHFEAALRLVPADADAHANLGNVRLLQNRASEAIDLYQAALRLRPNDPQVIQNLEVARSEAGKKE